MRSKKTIALLMTAAMLTSAVPAGLTAFAADEISLSDKPLTGGSSYQNKNPYGNAFDGDTATYFDGDRSSFCQVDLGANYALSKLRFYPRSGRSTDKPSEYAKRMNNGVFSASKDGVNWEEIYTVPGDFCTSNTDADAVKWYEVEVSGTYRYVKYSNDTIEANIAEIELCGTWESDSEAISTEAPSAAPTDAPLPEGFTILDRSGWTAAANSAAAASGNNSVEMVLDGKTNTIWHSKYSGAIENDKETNPIYLQIDMGSEQNISGIRYTPRTKGSASGDINGVITAYEVEVSADGSEWTKVGEGNLGYTADGTQEPKNIIFSPVQARYVRLIARDNLTNGSQYVASCAELDAYTYAGDEAYHPIAAARARLDEAKGKIEAVTADHAIKDKLISKADSLKISGTVDGIESFISATGAIIDALTWMESGIDDVYIKRIMDLLVEKDLSSSVITTANNELAGFYAVGADVKDNYAEIWQGEFTMSEEEYDKPLYERIQSAITRAKARIDSDDGNDYIMLKELVSYISGKYGYAGYENSYGRKSDEAEAVVNNINFALKNLDNGVNTELTTFKSGEIWLDTLGSKISAHGGQIIKQGDIYYWYGEDNKVSYPLTTGVSCYSSQDLKNWKYEGLAFKAFDDGTEEKQFTDEFMTDSLLGQQGRIERPKVIYNEKTGKYIMWMHLEKNGDYSLSIAGVAISDSPTGPFRWLWYGSPVRDSYVMVKESYSQTFRDMNLFVDDDGKAYVFYSSENNQTMYVVQLNDEYTWINDEGLTEQEEPVTLKAVLKGNAATFTVPEEETRALTGYIAAYNSNNCLAELKSAELSAGEQTISIDAENADSYKAFIWTDKMEPVINVQTEGSDYAMAVAESEIEEGKVIVPDMRDITSAKYTYGKTSFTRYQLASGGALSLTKQTADDGSTIYVSQRNDGRMYSPEYPETGRWARVGQNLGTESNADTTITSTTVNNQCSNQREAPAPIKIGDKYYLVTSALSGWRANPSLTQVSDCVLGTWTGTGNPMTGSGPANNGQWKMEAAGNTSFLSQSTCVLRLPNGEYMYMGDRWKNGYYDAGDGGGIVGKGADVKASTYVWLPITFETDSTHGENTLKVRWADSWSYDNISPEPTDLPGIYTEASASVAAQLRAKSEDWTEMNSVSTKFFEGESAIEVNGGTFMGAFYSFDDMNLPENAEVKSAKLIINKAASFKNIHYTVLHSGVLNDLTDLASIFETVSTAIANSDSSKIGETADGESSDGFGIVTIDVLNAFDANGSNSYFVYLPGAGNAKRNLQADARLVIEYE